MRGGGEDELFGLLRDVDARLAADDPKDHVTLYVLGGAAAVIAYGAKLGTRDIDVYIHEKRIGEKILGWAGQGTELATKHGIYILAANTTLMLIEEPEFMERSVEILKGRLKRIRVMALSPEDLILSKLSRYNDRDREHIQSIVENCKVDPDKFIAFYKSARQYYVGDGKFLDQTFNIVLREQFGGPPINPST